LLELLSAIRKDPSDPSLSERTTDKFRPRREPIGLSGRYKTIWPYIEAFAVVNAVEFFTNTVNVSTRRLHDVSDEAFRVRLFVDIICLFEIVCLGESYAC